MSVSMTTGAYPQDGLREIIRQFTPNWFTATMGTGILALALNQYPLPIPGLHLIGMVLWLGNILLFLTFSALYTARWIMFFDGARRIFGHSVISMFFGAIPMSLATIVNGFLVFGIPLWGSAALGIAHVLLWIDIVMAVAVGLFVPFLMFTRQDHSLDKMTAVWLLPVVASEVAAASIAQLVPHLTDPQVALRMLVIGYGLWALSVPLGLSFLVILLLRLTLHKLPPREMAASGFLALGPLGTGALGLLLLGGDAPGVFTAAGLPEVGQVARGIGIIGGTILLSYGAWWLMLAVMITIRTLRREGMPFNLGWWAFTFPIGVYSVGMLALARQTHLGFVATTGGILVSCLALLWLVVAVRTLRGAWRRTLFVAPCLIKGSIPQDLETNFL